MRHVVSSTIKENKFTPCVSCYSNNNFKRPLTIFTLQPKVAETYATH